MTIFIFTMLFFEAPFVPTPYPAVHKLLKEIKIKKGEKVYDLGAGDGRFIHFAEKKYGAKGIGFEINYPVYLLARIKRLFFGWKGKMIFGNFMKRDISDADVIIFYLMPNYLKKFQKTMLKKLKKGTRIVSYAFKVGTLKPIKIIPKKDRISNIYIYKV